MIIARNSAQKCKDKLVFLYKFYFLDFGFAMDVLARSKCCLKALAIEQSMMLFGALVLY